MKYVKENLTLVIVGAVVVLLLVAAFVWPIPSYRAALAETMEKRANQRATIAAWGKTELVVAGQTQPVYGPPNDEWVQAKHSTIKDLDNYRLEVEKAAKASNASLFRLNKQGVPLLPIPTKSDLSTAGIPIGTHLPVSNDPMEFKARYLQLFKFWSNALTMGTLSDSDPAPAIPPKLEDIQKEFTENQTAAMAKLPPGPGGQPAAAPSAAMGNKQFMEHSKTVVMNRAAGLRMYLEPSPNGFQIREWAFKDESPKPPQIFEAVVDTWIQADIVRAITIVNNQAMVSSVDKNVGKAAIKRLTRIVIGNAARTRQLGTSIAGGAPAVTAITDPGPLFFTSSNASSVGGSGGAVMGPLVTPGGGMGAPADTANAEVPENKIDPELGLTGHSAGKDYDVVQVSILLDIDPAYLNAFIDAIYRQNMGYTENSRQIRTVDPLDRASNGYLFGDGQVVEAEIQLEALFFRSWTVEFMPNEIRGPLSIKPIAAATTTAPGAAPAP